MRLRSIRLWSVFVCMTLPCVARASAPGTVVRPERRSEEPRPLSPAQFSPNGKLLVTVAADGSLSVCDVGSGTRRFAFGRVGRSDAAAIAPDGESLVAYMADETLRAWSLASGKRLLVAHGSKEPIISATYSPDGRALAIVRVDGRIDVCDARTGAVRFRVAPQFHSHVPAAFSPGADAPGGGALATVGADGVLHVWDLTSGTSRFSITHYRRGAFAPDGTYGLALCGQDVLCVFNVRSGKARAIQDRGSRYVGAQFAPDSGSLATLNGDGLLRLWDPASGRKRGEFAGANEGALDIPLRDGAQGASHWESSGTVLVTDISLRQ
jgi:WD40 repeat protein